MGRYQFTKIWEATARGGLSEAMLKTRPALVKSQHTSTRPGRFTIRSVEKHVSGSRWPWSAVAWGTPVKIEKDITWLKSGNGWKKLSSVPAWNNMLAQAPDRKTAEASISQYLKDRYAGRLPDDRFDYRQHYGKELDSWVFNDFGHVSIKYFLDKNNNGRLDDKAPGSARETLMSDFVHTGPRDEAVSFRNRRTGRHDVLPLEYSHGCIHVRPDDIDQLINNGYARPGNIIEIHPYSHTQVIRQHFEAAEGKPQHELHFYPRIGNGATDGSGQLVVYSVQKIS